MMNRKDQISHISCSLFAAMAILIFSGHVASQAPASAKSAQGATRQRSRGAEERGSRGAIPLRSLIYTQLSNHAIIRSPLPLCPLAPLPPCTSAQTALTPCPLAVKLHLTETG
ncbi:MAG: hypothetical protein L0229_14750, partial [Blastocatellia bacterium]|nr:hypothetical protein [Blastocatellia bacterium]